MIVVQSILPALRMEVTRQLIDNYGMRKTDAAAKMGITPAAVSQYLGKTRVVQPPALSRARAE